MRVRLVLLASAIGLVLPLPSGAAVEDLAIFAASAEAYGVSAEIGIPGPAGPFTAHTWSALDNSPHSGAAAGLADPGFLIRAAAGLQGLSTPTYCESAYPEGPPQSDCSVVPPSADGSVAAARSSTTAGHEPSATGRSAVVDATLGDAAAPAVRVQNQSTASSTTAAGDVVEAMAEASVKGLELAGGAIRIESFKLRRTAAADGSSAPTSERSLTMSGIEVGGQRVDPGGDPLKALTAAAKALQPSITVVAGRDEEAGDAQRIGAASSGFDVIWQINPTTFAHVVVGRVDVLSYAVPGGGALDANPAVLDQLGLGPPSSSPSPAPFADTATVPAGAPPAPGLDATGGPAAPPAGATRRTTHAPAARLTFGTPRIQYLSPLEVAGQMATGDQAGWLLLALAPIAAALAARPLRRQAAIAVPQTLRTLKKGVLRGPD